MLIESWSMARKMNAGEWTTIGHAKQFWKHSNKTEQGVKYHRITKNYSIHKTKRTH